jgi:ABC-2 type transport system permease protein
MSSIPWALAVLAGGVRIQLARGRGGSFLLGAVITPVLTTVTFVLIARYVGKEAELAPFLVVAPALMGLWSGAIFSAGEIIGDERFAGTLELLVAAPAATELAILGRVLASAFLALIAFPEVLAVSAMLGVTLEVRDPLLAIGALLALAASTLALSLFIASTFVLARSARYFQNVIGYPLYILSGVAFPIGLLPVWLQPLSAAVSLSWGASALRAALGRPSGDPSASLLAMLALTVVYALFGHWLFTRIERTIRATGEVGFSA